MQKQKLKQTESNKISIPDGWNLVKLSDPSLFEIIMGQSPPSEVYNTQSKGLPFYQGNADFGVLHPIPRIFCDKPTKIAEKDDVLISVRAPVGELNIADTKCCIGRGVAAIRSKTKDTKYIYYILNHLKSKWTSEKTTFEGIKKGHIEKKEILWATEPERKIICNYLETTDIAIQKAGEAINKTERLKEGLMRRFFLSSKGIEMPIGDKLTLEYGASLVENERKAGYYQVYGSSGVIGAHDEYLIEGPGIIVGRKGTIGAVNWSDSNFWCIDTTYYVKLKDISLNLKWLYYKLISLHLEKLNMATGTPGLNRDMVYVKKTFFVSPIEQAKAVKVMEIVDKKLYLGREKKLRLERVKKGLMNDLLSGKVRVRVGENVKI